MMIILTFNFIVCSDAVAHVTCSTDTHSHMTCSSKVDAAMTCTQS